MASLRVALVGNPEGWHAARLGEALERRGARVLRLPATRLTGAVGDRGAVGSPFAGAVASLGRGLEDRDLILVRAVPSGSLEQVIFRLDGLRRLERQGIPVVNGPDALERSVDKYVASCLLEEAGIPTPRTRVTESFDEAREAFRELGGDVVIKPLFGSEGRGIVRASDPESAWRAFKALELGRSVFYVQEYLPHGREDLRLFVIDGEVAGAMVRRGEDWRTNIARGAKGVPLDPDPETAALAVRAARAVGAFYAGVDLLVLPDGSRAVGEVNGSPGWRGLEAATGIPVADRLADRLLERLGDRS
jgi:RimK family alpha-L-glutamate ligase